LLVRDEISGFLRDLDREDRAGDRAKYLEMWDGKGELTYDRIQRGTVRIESNTLAILGSIQPDLLTAYVREAVRGGMGNDGLLQRFQMSVWPDVFREFRNVDEWPDTAAKNQAFEVFQYLDALTPEQAEADATEGGIPFLRFTADAQLCFDAWRVELENKLRNGSEHPAFEAHLAKYRKLVPALALLIHLTEQNTGAVSLPALSKALLWADYLEAHARRIYAAILRPDTAAARELAKHLQRGDLPAQFRLREIYRKGWTALNTKEDAEAATEILCDLDWIRPAFDASARPPGTSGRPASPTFDVNPKIAPTRPFVTDTTDTNGEEECSGSSDSRSVIGYENIREEEKIQRDTPSPTDTTDKSKGRL
jgi:putative DNA primase/helicase